MMPHLNGLIDVSAWTGTWPFDLNGPVSLQRLIDRLEHAGIAEALVSPLDAVLAPDPMPANRALLAACADASDPAIQVHPVPVINPAMATWRSDLAAIVEPVNGAIPAVRLLPTWHGWGPEHPEATACLRTIAGHGLVPIVQARMIDERAMPVVASPARFGAEEVAAWLRGGSDTPVVLAGLYRPELRHIAAFDHVAVDLAFIEADDTLASILEVLPPERVLLGTHAPLLEPLSAVAKLPVEGPHSEVAARVGRDSARDWLGLATGVYCFRTRGRA